MHMQIYRVLERGCERCCWRCCAWWWRSNNAASRGDVLDGGAAAEDGGDDDEEEDAPATAAERVDADALMAAPRMLAEGFPDVDDGAEAAEDEGTVFSAFFTRLPAGDGVVGVALL